MTQQFRESSCKSWQHGNMVFPSMFPYDNSTISLKWWQKYLRLQTLRRKSHETFRGLKHKVLKPHGRVIFLYCAEKKRDS